MRTYPFIFILRGVAFLSLTLNPANVLAANESSQAELRADSLLHKGDITPLEAAFEKRDLLLLWHAFSMAEARQYGGGVTGAEKRAAPQEELMNPALNQKILDAATKYISLIPGHAKMWGDKIEEWSNQPDNGNKRTAYLHRLGVLGSMEAIQQAGRFMFDDRCPELNQGIVFTHIPKPSTNGLLAATALHIALKDKSPAKGKLGASGLFLANHAPLIEEWWRSDESLPYRQALPGVELPEAVRNPPSAAAVAERRRLLRERLNAPSKEAGGEGLPLWQSVLGLFTVLILAGWLAMKKRKPRPSMPAVSA